MFPFGEFAFHTSIILVFLKYENFEAHYMICGSSGNDQMWLLKAAGISIHEALAQAFPLCFYYHKGETSFQSLREFLWSNQSKSQREHAA